MNQLRMIAAFAFLLCVALGLAQSKSTVEPKDKRMNLHASGPFEVKLLPQADAEINPSLARMTIDKQFHGDLEATSKGQMLSATSTVGGSGVYVALEKVTGTLKGRKGSFVLYHTGIMDRGTPTLSVTVAPDSGTDELTGITGKMNIIIAPGGKHSYEFDYTIPDRN